MPKLTKDPRSKKKKKLKTQEKPNSDNALKIMLAMPKICVFYRSTTKLILPHNALKKRSTGRRNY